MIGHEDRRHFCWSVRNEPWSQEATIANINHIIDEDGVPVFRTRIIQVKKTLTHVSKKPIQNEVLRVCFNYLVPYLKVVQQYVCCHFPREIKLMSFFCFLLSIFSIAFVFCILLSAFCFPVVIAVHVCYGGRGGLAGASIDLIWAFSASGFDTLTCLKNLAYLAFSIFVALLLTLYEFCF